MTRIFEIFYKKKAKTTKKKIYQCPKTDLGVKTGDRVKNRSTGATETLFISGQKPTQSYATWCLIRSGSETDAVLSLRMSKLK